MPIPDALIPFAEHFGLQDSETLARIFGMLYDHEDDLALIPALPGKVKEVSAKTGIPEERVKDELYRLALKGAVMKMPSGEFVLPDILLELRDFSAIWPEAPLITTVPCPCRLQARIAGKRPSECPAGEKSFCLQTGGMAQALVNRGIATVLSTEEALIRIDEAAGAGLVHNVTDFADDFETASRVGMSICNCCPCCCILLYSVYQGFPEILGNSGYRPVLNPDACIGCGECAEHCPFHAVSMDEIAFVNTEKCLGCGNCALICPEQAFTMEKMETPPVHF
jgi:electron transport complex protein RnfB